jgi:hypothetical protein
MNDIHYRKPGLRSALAAGCAVLALASVSVTPDFAWADQGAGKGQQSHGQQGGKGGDHGAGNQGGNAGRGLGGIFRDITGMGDDAVADDDDGDDSDRPAWAGVPGGKDDAGGGQPSIAGSKRGDLFGDLWVIERDEDGNPVFVQVGDEYLVNPLDENGDAIGWTVNDDGDVVLVDPLAVVEVELGRLNVGRAPTKVLDNRADEVVTLLNSATAISTDASGRIVLTVDVDGDGVAEDKTIDSPLENLAIYVALMETGSIPDVTFTGTASDPILLALFDGQMTADDLALSTAFLAAATDKTSEFTTDEIAYINSFLGINTTEQYDVTYSDIDYSDFTYDRYATFGDATADILVLENGVYVPKEDVLIYELVFGTIVDANNDGIPDDNVVASATLDAYTQAAEDSRTIIEFIHNLALPE